MDNHRSPLFSCLLCCLVVLASGCASSQNAMLQNTTTKFNILYNAERLLSMHREQEELFISDDYNDLLPVFKTPQRDNEVQLLDSVILKANTIINKKTHSDYLDDAYFLIAEANFLKGNFYSAAEFYSYIYTNYPKESELAQRSRINKAKALLSLGDVHGATAMLDSAWKYSKSSKKEVLSDLFALKTQFLIMEEQFKEAGQMLGQALSANPAKQTRQRWTFLLAQLQERNNQKALAFKNYKNLRKSITPSELSFHADFNQSRLNADLNGLELDEISILRKFLNNSLYIDFQDRIYYMMGKVQERNNELTDALVSFKNSVRTSSKNSGQKGISYVSLAESYFRSGFYNRSLSFYDSALLSLPPSHIRYADIQKKKESLSHLSAIFESINFEETLQRIAGLPEDKRQHEVADLIRRRNSEELEYPISSVLIERAVEPEKTDFFYFNSPKALKQGAIDFQEKWGSRILKDDWRYETTGAAIAEQMLTADPALQGKEATKSSGTPERRFDDYINNLPVGPDALKASDERIAASLYEIGLFYLNKLQDEKLASTTFEKIAGRFAETSYALPSSYRLYLIKRKTEPVMAKRYQDLILTKYAQSEIAGIIRRAASDQTDFALDAPDALYTKVYNLFANKQYEDVIREVEALRGNVQYKSLSTQLEYLYSIAMGYNQNPGEFEDALQSFVIQHAEDSLVTPLVRQHLDYISRNKESFFRRPFALINNDTLEPDQNIPEVSMQSIPERPAAPSEKADAGTLSEPLQSDAKPSVTAPPEKEAVVHYFVVNVRSATANLSPSRFGIGQFNRSTYPGFAIKHQLKVVNKENQLIFVGPFPNKEEALSYEARILPMIKEIMKIPAERYNTFVISQEGLGQLNTREQIETHIEHTTKNIK